MAVFVLQAFAIERGAPGGAAEQESARLHVAGRPGQVPDTLKAEHRVIHVERHHDAVVGAVGGGGRYPAAHAAGLVDALLQDLALFVFLVIHHLVFIDWCVLLPLRVVDADLAEQPFHAKGARLVHQNRHHARTQRLVAQQGGKETHIGLCGGYFAPFGGGFHHRLEGFERWHGELFVGPDAAVRQIAAQRFAPLVQITHLRGVVGRLVERNVRDPAVGNWNVETVAKGLDVFVGQFLGLVHVVLAFADLAHAETLDGLDQQHAWLALVVNRCMKRRVDLLRVVAATAQLPDIVVAHLGNHLRGARVPAEKVLANVGAVIGLEGLVVAIQRVHHDLAQRAILVARQQRVPVTAPYQLDHIPARAAKLAFKLLNDLAIATHRAVKALQVAIDDEDQVVEAFARGQPDRAHAFHFVHLAIAAEHPDLAVRGVGNAACMQVLEKTCLINRHQRPQAHRDGRKLPELGHQFGMRVTGQTFAIHLLAEVEQLLFAQAPFHEGPRVNTRRHVPLYVDAVAAMLFSGLGALGMPEVVEASAKQTGQRGEGADVAAQVAAIDRVVAVGLDHHRHRVPAHVGAQPFFDLEVAGTALFLVRLQRIDITGIGRERHIDTALARVFQQFLKQKVGTRWAFTLDHGGQGVHPLAGFLLVVIVCGGAEQVLWNC